MSTETDTTGLATGRGDASVARLFVSLLVPLPRAMTWRRILRGVHTPERVEWQGAAAGWAAEYLEPGIPWATTAAPA